MRIFTLPGVFRPRSDSWLLASVIRERVRPGETFVDPFTGSGVLAIAAAKAGARATAIDISRRAALTAKVNARLNDVELEVLRADSMAPLDGRRFDLIAANPPYVPGPDVTPRGAARAWEGGSDGRKFIDRLCAEAGARLNARGRLLLIHSSHCGEAKTLELLGAQDLSAKVIARHRGALGPLMAERTDRLAKLGADSPDEEELLIFEAVAPG